MPSPFSRRTGARRKHRRARAAPAVPAIVATPSPFARLNQDCVDAVAEYAAGSVGAVAALRAASVGLHRGVSNVVRFRCHEARPSVPPHSLLWCSAIDAFAKHLGPFRCSRGLPCAAAHMAVVLMLDSLEGGAVQRLYS